MKDIRSILAEHEIPEDVAKAIETEVKANYKTVKEFAKKTDRIAELEAANADLAEAAGKVEGSTQEIEQLRKKVKDFEDAETARVAAEAEAKRRADFTETFNAALGDRKFANSIIEESVFEKAFRHCTENTGASAKDAIDAAVKDIDNVWVNPQNDPRRMPTAQDISTRQASEETVKRSFADALFGTSKN